MKKPWILIRRAEPEVGTPSGMPEVPYGLVADPNGVVWDANLTKAMSFETAMEAFNFRREHLSDLSPSPRLHRSDVQEHIETPYAYYLGICRGATHTFIRDFNSGRFGENPTPEGCIGFDTQEDAEAIRIVSRLRHRVYSYQQALEGIIKAERVAKLSLPDLRGLKAHTEDAIKASLSKRIQRFENDTDLKVASLTVKVENGVVLAVKLDVGSI